MRRSEDRSVGTSPYGPEHYPRADFRNLHCGLGVALDRKQRVSWVRVDGGNAGAGFWRTCRGSVAVANALTISVVIVVFAGLAEIVRTAYDDDTMARAARAAARAIALAPDSTANGGNLDAIACTAIRQELSLGAGFDCAARWTLTIDAGLTPAELLSSTLPAAADRTGDMVVVRIARDRQPWNIAGLIRNSDAAARQARREVAVGLARSEPRTDS